MSLFSKAKPTKEPPAFDINQERQEVPLDRPAIFDGLGPHDFVESEFAPGSGRCDKCGGGRLASLHVKPVDQMARIADALERIAGTLEEISMAMPDGPSIDAMLDALQPKTKADGE